jgi:hypothetical protein
LGAKDRKKDAAIGESDRFTLRFVKSEPASQASPPTKTSTRLKP